MRQALCEIGRRVWQRNYIAANDGNFSVLLREDLVLCTPTMISKGFMTPEDLVLITPDGEHVAGRRRMTSEIKMHLEIYRRRKDVRAVVHVHPPHATAFAIARRSMPKCVLPEIEIFIGEIPVTPYETPGTQQFADILVPFLEHHNAFILTNHGAVTIGTDPFEAYYRMETIDQYCNILILASQIGGWEQIQPGKVAELFGIREKLGLKERRTGGPLDAICQIGVPGEKLAAADGTSRDQIAEIVSRVIAKLNPSN